MFGVANYLIKWTFQNNKFTILAANTRAWGKRWWKKYKVGLIQNEPLLTAH